MFENLVNNILHEKKLLKDIVDINNQIKKEPSKKKIYQESLISIIEQLKLLNGAVPEMLKQVSSINKKTLREPNIKKLKISPKKKMNFLNRNNNPKTLDASYISSVDKKRKYITINKGDKKDFLEKLKISETGLSGMKKSKMKKSSEKSSGPNYYTRMSNKIFKKTSEKISSSFNGLEKDLKKGNIRFLISSYLSMAIMGISIAFIFGILIFGILLIFSLSNFLYIWIPFALVGLVSTGFYLYPASVASSLQKQISYELPFSTIYMAAIAGSDIEPTKIFKIIGNSKEYPAVGAEIRKVLVQVEIYGYDLVTSLKNVALNSSNKKLSELFSGFATNISTGGALKNYLENKANNYMVDYRLERQRYSGLAETFMNVYISILIAAPLVLMMMFIVMNVAGLGLGSLSISTLLILSILAIIILNIIFLIVLNIKQPKV